MAEVWANEFQDILPTLQQRHDLRDRVLVLADQETPGRVTEGGDRLQRLRAVLRDLANGALTLPEAYVRVGRELPRSGSPYAGNNRVFASGWEERLVRTQLSRLYNQAVLEHLLEAGQTECYVPHSSAEDAASPCSRVLAGHRHAVAVLYDRLVGSYTRGNWSDDPKIPEHPHCTHVVRPIDIPAPDRPGVGDVGLTVDQR